RLLQKVEQSILAAPADEAPVALIAVALDVSASAGETLLDDLRITFARRLQKAVAEGDVVARASGNEFLILLTDLMSRADPVAVAERVLAAGKQPFEMDGRKIGGTPSAGVAFGSSRPSDLLRDAEVALFQARRRGGGRHEQHSPGLRASLRSVQPLEA